VTKNRILAGLCAATALTLAPQAVAAQDSTDAAAAAEQTLTIEPQVRTRDMTGTFGGQRVSYRATIAETVLKADDGKPEAVIVTTSYVKQPRDTSRPVFFLFNGGPGSGSVIPQALHRAQIGGVHPPGLLYDVWDGASRARMRDL